MDSGQLAVYRAPMRASEIFLGIAGSLGAWLVVTGHALILDVVPQVDCSVDRLDPWRGTLVMGGLALLSVPLLGTGLPWRDGVRWVTVPAVPLLVYGTVVALPYLEVTLQGTHPCVVHGALATGDAAPDVWQRLWAPLQLLVVAGGLGQALRYWWPRKDVA